MKLAAFLGDGIGPEVVTAALEVLATANEGMHLGLEVRTHPCGLEAARDHGSTFPEASRQAAAEADGIILGPLSTAEYPSLEPAGINASATLRLELDLYANIRPSRSPAGIDAACPGMDLTIVRENTEGFYAVRTMQAGSGEFAPDPDSAFAVRKITAGASRRIAERAFALARHRRGKVTAVNKSNVLKITDGLFLRECRTVAAKNPDIVYEEELVDAVAAKLVRDRGGYDVLVTTNLFGDILSNEAAELSGGLGLADINVEGTAPSLFEPIHGSAPDIAGKGLANPASMILSVALLLSHLGERSARSELRIAAGLIEAALMEGLASEATRTPDLGGRATTTSAADAVVANLRRAISRAG